MLMFEQDKTKIGIIGLGFVGGAIKKALDDNFDVKLYCIDQDPTRGSATYADIKECDGVFICVPSPQDADGTCDTSILESVLQELSNIDYTGVVISKCTAPPLTYKRLQQQFPNLVHAPEFLTAANAFHDYVTGKFSFIGGAVGAYCREAERLIRMSQPSLQTITHCSIEEAALAKYTINSFMATKVIFMNEIEALSRSLGCEYNAIATMVTDDPRIGNSHMKVPGPDGQYGFGGACFPKDTSALLKIAEEVGIDMNVLDAAVKKNLLLRLTDSK